MAQQLKIDIVARDKSKQALNSLKGRLGKLKASVFDLRNAFIGLGAGLAIRSLVNTGKQIEGLQVRLKFLFGSAKEGAKAFDEMAKFAAKVPFSLEEIQSGSGVLSVVSKDAKELAELMEITGNVAAVTGLDFRTTAEQIQRSMSAGISAADLFRDRGVKSMLGFKAGATVSVEETAEAFKKIFGKGGKFGGATDELANTFEGTLSMIGDKFFNFKRTILEAGFFEGLKKQFGELDVALAQNAELIEKIGVGVGTTLALAVEKVAQSIKLIAEYSNLVKETFKIIISYKLAKLFLNIGRALIPVVSGMSAIAALTGPVGIGLAAAAAAAGTAAYFLLGKQLDSIAEKIEANHKAYKESKRIFTGGGFDASQFTKKELFDIAEIEKIIAKAKEKQLKLQNFLITANNKKKSEFLRLEKEAMEKAEKLELFLLTEKNKKRLEFHQLEKEAMEQVEANRIEKIREEGSALENLKENYREFFENFNVGREVADIFFNSLQSVTKGIGDAVAQAVVFGKSFKDTFGNIARNILAQLISSLVQVGVNMVVNAMIGKKLQAASVASGVASAAILSAAWATPAALASLASFGSNAIPASQALISTVALSNILSSVKSHEQGGAVSKGKSVLVGERGPELFIPNTTGQITQNARGTDTGTTNINFSINATDVTGVRKLLIDNRATIVNVINSALNEKGREALVWVDNYQQHQKQIAQQ